MRTSVAVSAGTKMEMGIFSGIAPFSLSFTLGKSPSSCSSWRVNVANGPVVCCGMAVSWSGHCRRA